MHAGGIYAGCAWRVQEPFLNLGGCGRSCSHFTDEETEAPSANVSQVVSVGWDRTTSILIPRRCFFPEHSGPGRARNPVVLQKGPNWGLSACSGPSVCVWRPHFSSSCRPPGRSWPFTLCLGCPRCDRSGIISVPLSDLPLPILSQQQPG